MSYKVTIDCPRDPSKKYFCRKLFKYSNKLDIYLNSTLLWKNINDVEERLPISLSKDVDIDFLVDNTFRFVYNISINGTKECAEVQHCLSKDHVHTKIIRHNYVHGSDTLEDDYTITFDVNGSKQNFGKEYHKGDTKLLKFTNKYSIPLVIQWYSVKNFPGMPETHDHIILNIKRT